MWNSRPNVIILSFMLFVAQIALAQTSPQPVFFIPAAQALKDLVLPLNAMAATPLLRIPGKTGLDRCSSSVVSDEGNFLSAGHCIEDCLVKAGAIHDDEGITVVDRTRLTDLRCPMEINGKMTKVKVLATNDCRGNDKDKAGNSRVACKGLDFALLQEDDSHIRSGLPCYKVSETKPEPGQAAASIGYPAKTFRATLKNGAGDSDGQSEYFSLGKTVPFQNFCKPNKDTPAPPLNFGNPDRAAVLKRNIEAGDVIQTVGAEAIYEMSGGSLMDLQSHELVGVVRSSIGNSPYVECDGSSFHTSTYGILRYLKTEFPQLDLTRIFHCTSSLSSARAPAPAPAAGTEHLEGGEGSGTATH